MHLCQLEATKPEGSRALSLWWVCGSLESRLSARVLGQREAAGPQRAMPRRFAPAVDGIPGICSATAHLGSCEPTPLSGLKSPLI